MAARWAWLNKMQIRNYGGKINDNETMAKKKKNASVMNYCCCCLLFFFFFLSLLMFVVLCFLPLLLLSWNHVHMHGYLCQTISILKCPQKLGYFLSREEGISISNHSNLTFFFPASWHTGFSLLILWLFF